MNLSHLAAAPAADARDRSRICCQRPLQPGLQSLEGTDRQPSTDPAPTVAHPGPDGVLPQTPG